MTYSNDNNNNDWSDEQIDEANSQSDWEYVESNFSYSDKEEDLEPYLGEGDENSSLYENN